MKEGGLIKIHFVSKPSQMDTAKKTKKWYDNYLTGCTALYCSPGQEDYEHWSNEPHAKECPGEREERERER
jgi:hypothetical protein